MYDKPWFYRSWWRYRYSGGGGRLLRNGNELLDEKNGAEKLDLLNQIYPVGSLFICKTGTGSPASKYGGEWQCLAENVAMPLGTYAPVGAFSNNFISISDLLDGTAISWTEQITSGRKVMFM